MNAELVSTVPCSIGHLFLKIIYKEICSLWTTSPIDFSDYRIPFFLFYILRN